MDYGVAGLIRDWLFVGAALCRAAVAVACCVALRILCVRYGRRVHLCQDKLLLLRLHQRNVERTCF